MTDEEILTLIKNHSGKNILTSALRISGDLLQQLWPQLNTRHWEGLHEELRNHLWYYLWCCLGNHLKKDLEND